MASRSVASGEAAGNMACSCRGSLWGSESSMVAAKGDWISSMSSADGRPATRRRHGSSGHSGHSGFRWALGV